MTLDTLIYYKYHDLEEDEMIDLVHRFKEIAEFSLNIKKSNFIMGMAGSLVCDKDQNFQNILINYLLKFRIENQNESFWEDNVLTIQKFILFI
jgi:hypothetical protein